MKHLRNLIKAYRLCRQFDEITKEKLDKLDKENLAATYVDVKWKSQEKLINNIIVDLQNKGFKESEKLEEFLAIKWVSATLTLYKNEIKQHYINLTQKKDAKSSREEATRFQGYEDLPDGEINGQNVQKANI
jgi:hypothetical protein